MIMHCMCAQFLIKAAIKDIEDLFGLKVEDPTIAWNERILPYTKAPVVTARGLRLMNFSLIPNWSPDPKPKFATHNARIETITEKATWKKPFINNHCLVPLTSFIEPIYEGELAGNMVRFNAKDPMIAAGIFDQWIHKTTGEVIESFAIITTEPNEYIKNVGHDRQPVFLIPPQASEWLRDSSKNPQNVKTQLLSLAANPELSTSIDRPLKSGWEKKISK